MKKSTIFPLAKWYVIMYNSQKSRQKVMMQKHTIFLKRACHLKKENKREKRNFVKL